MGYFEEIYTRLFSKTEDSQKTVHENELIKRSQSFIDQFETWKSSKYTSDLLDELWQSYYWGKQGVDKDPQMVILESTYSNGISIDYESKFNKNDFQYLFDFLAEQVKKLDYRLVVSRRTLTESDDRFKSIEMHYLKPKTGFVEPVDQKFGNVQIEYIEENNEPIRIKLIANSYPDRKYKRADSFEKLAQHIFSNK
ncbi:hypothetical protein [Ekhidna sp.]|uniref:hypothetical protein n=1 Tax=Ekhidna sp. TaxID=2608089 RepID=UPI003B50FEFA